jgi:hypothetical protein
MLRATDVEEIKEKIKKGEEKKIKAQGAKEQIESNWKKSYGLKSKDAAQARADDLRGEIEEDKKEQTKLLKELEGIADWEAL